MEPFEVTLELHALYPRAVEDPGSITRGELNEIFRRPPPEEEGREIQSRFKLASRVELVAKANTFPGTLTEDEVDYLTPEFNFPR